MFLDTEARPAGEPAKVGTLKLSEAMRIGARLRPQQFCSPRVQSIGSCALAAASEAVTGSIEHYCERWARRVYGISEEISNEIWHRNDNLKMPREEIADWLESQGY